MPSKTFTITWDNDNIDGSFMLPTIYKLLNEYKEGREDFTVSEINVSHVIEILKERCYCKEDYDACLEDMSNMDNPEFFDHAACIILLGGELEE